MSVPAKVATGGREFREAVVRYLRIGEGRPPRPAEAEATSEPPRPAGRHWHPPRVHVHLPKRAPKTAPATALVPCYDCDAEIPANAEQCPYCALFLDRAA